MLEIRAGTGGDEATLFAAEIFRFLAERTPAPEINNRDVARYAVCQFQCHGGFLWPLSSCIPVKLAIKRNCSAGPSAESLFLDGRLTKV